MSLSLLAREPIIVADLGFGDAGKGTVVDFLVRELACGSGARAVVRFHGGAQAGHNVVTRDGSHHTFSQIGAGGFVPEVETFLARHVVVHPLALVVEASRLEARGVVDPLSRVKIDGEALVVTPFHQAAARLREIARGDARHGSCGVGVGETVHDALHAGEPPIRYRDLHAERTYVRRSLARAQARKRDEIAALGAPFRGCEGAASELALLEDEGVIDRFLDAAAPLVARDLVRDGAYLGRLLEGQVIFEGAQGVLLDEGYGFHPFTTYSTCTFDRATELLAEHGRRGVRLGVVRTYATRHGPGPFPTEDRALSAKIDEPHNRHDRWQGSFRAGWLDLVLLRYALAATRGADALAVTHVDTIDSLAAHGAPFSVARAYDGIGELALGRAHDLTHTEALGRALLRAEPILEEVRATSEAPGPLLDVLEASLKTRVVLTSHGPTAEDKRHRANFPRP